MSTLTPKQKVLKLFPKAVSFKDQQWTDGSLWMCIFTQSGGGAELGLGAKTAALAWKRAARYLSQGTW